MNDESTGNRMRKARSSIHRDVLGQVIEYVAELGTSSSRLIHDALESFVEGRRRSALRASLAEGYEVHGERDLQLAEVFASADSDATALHGLQDWVDEQYGDRKPKGVVDDLIADRRNESSRE